MAGDGGWLTVGEAHRRLQAEPQSLPISEQTVRRMVDRGELAAVKVGNRRRIPAKAVEELKARMWAESHPEEGQDEAGLAPEAEPPAAPTE